MNKNFPLFFGLSVAVCGTVFLVNGILVSSSPINSSLHPAEGVISSVSAAPKNDAFPQAGNISSVVAEARASFESQDGHLDGAFECILDSDPIRRVEGVRALVAVHSNRLLPLLISLLQGDEDAGVRLEAASALENFESVPAASLALVAALKDADPGVRENALLSLRMHRNDRVQAALYAQLKHGGCEESTCQAVAVFLTRYYPQLDPFDDLLKRASNL